MSCWKDKLLSKPGKEVLIKAVIQAMPTYIMSLFRIPDSIVEEIHKLMNRFWWGSSDVKRKIHWQSWEKLCSPKGNGGMGFRDLKDFNQAFLTKQCWRLLINPDSLVHAVMKARYFKRSGVLDACRGHDPSYFWKSWWGEKGILPDGLGWKIGNGRSVRVWEDPWLFRDGVSVVPQRGSQAANEELNVAYLLIHSQIMLLDAEVTVGYCKFMAEYTEYARHVYGRAAAPSQRSAITWKSPAVGKRVLRTTMWLNLLVKILKKLKHENIIEMLDSFETAEEFCVVSEFAQGELFQILENDKCLTEAQVKALHYLHSNRIIHRDLKPQNILICSGFTVKLCDFGFARAMSTKTVVLHSVKGTPLYRAPELVREQPYNHSVDLWSLGVILYDPVKYPEQMSPEFKSFLKGLLNKVQQQRLSWPAILEHPFIKESSVDLEESPAAKISMGCQAAEEGKTSMMPLPLHSKTLTSENWQPLERLENNSCTVEGAKIIGQEVEALTLILEPIKIFYQGAQTSSRRGALHNTIQSLRILSNLVAAEAVTSTCVDEIIFDLLGLTSSLMREKSNDLCDLIAKNLYIIRILIDGSGLSWGTSYFTQWVALVELFSQIVSSSEDSSGRVLHESNSCIAVMLNQVMLAVKELDFSAPFNVIEMPKQIPVHAKTSNLVDCLCMSLKTAETNYLGSDNFLTAASEGCRALWCLVDALENLSLKEKSRAFPLTSLRRHLLVNNMDCDRLPDIGTGSEKVVEAITKAFLNFKPVRVVMRFCLRQHAEEVLLAAIQLLLRCCMHSGIIPCVLCGIPISFLVEAVINGGGGDTIVSDTFFVISLCGSYLNEDSSTAEANDLKCKYTNLNGLALHSCLLLATIAQSFNSAGRNSTGLILTTSSKNKQSRLWSLARLFSSSGVIASFEPHRASAMLAFASLLSMESGTSVEPSVSDIAIPYIPCISALCDYLKMNHKDDLEINHTATNYMLTLAWVEGWMCWLAQNKIEMGRTDLMGLSPVGVVWAVSCLSHCLTCSAAIFRQMMLVNAHVKGISALVSSAHLKLIRSWSGPGGGKNGVRDIINVTIEFLAFPFVAIENAFGFPSATASMNGGCLLNVSSPGANIGNAAFHNDSLYEELRRSISHLTNLLLLPEEDITKLNAAGALGNLVRHSNLLCEDIVSHGAIQPGIPSTDATSESPLKNALFALANMCADYSPSRNIICLLESYQEIVQFQKAKYARIICSKAGGA
uniref:non-specific serine/threonine protein kinase n=1 Tax=Chenopodium quinoa TaxID=63459 RepID=A0A803L3C5_CHEQI